MYCLKPIIINNNNLLFSIVLSKKGIVDKPSLLLTPYCNLENVSQPTFHYVIS